MLSFFVSHTLAEKIIETAIKVSGIATGREEMQYLEKQVPKLLQNRTKAVIPGSTGLCGASQGDTQRSAVFHGI